MRLSRGPSEGVQLHARSDRTLSLQGFRPPAGPRRYSREGPGGSVWGIDGP